MGNDNNIDTDNAITHNNTASKICAYAQKIEQQVIGVASDLQQDMFQQLAVNELVILGRCGSERDVILVLRLVHTEHQSFLWKSTKIITGGDDKKGRRVMHDCNILG